ncbi:hypothetical protein E0H40_31010 [Rhizobium leguminosarum bv. viciae]|nr:hypothetical protein E0H40_31010 [Rhizobium leguminosarum bv. viciae]
MPKPDPRGPKCVRRSCGAVGAAASLIGWDPRQGMAGRSRRRHPRRSRASPGSSDNRGRPPLDARLPG